MSASACRPCSPSPSGSRRRLDDQRRHAFERVYAEARWIAGADGAGCKSGWSDVAAGQGSAAPALGVVGRYGVASLTDVPCGDFCFGGAALSRLRATAPGLAYEGIDVVPSLVDAHAALHSDNRTRFVSLDVASLERLPRPTDLVFSRQMTQHLCNADVAAFLSAVNRSDAKLALLTTFDVGPGFENTDIGCASGGYRAQSLTAPPFSLPPPLRFFSEEYPTDPRVGLGLWKIPFFA